jgi:glycosyltransferase involved in cell wall biosynthesis
MTAPSVTVVVPAFREDEGIARVLDRLTGGISLEFEILVVVDDPADPTVAAVAGHAGSDPRIRTLVNTYGRGPANAIRFGIDHARNPGVVVTMADGSDDPRMIDPLARLVERGVVVAAASRYSPGGQQVGGPVIKTLLSRSAGRSLGTLARVGTDDATNSFKAYSTDFVHEVGIHSRSGFEIGLELTAKARRLRRPVAELPTIWLDRTLGESSFDLKGWVPKYLRWYFFAFGPALTVEEVRREAAKIAARNEEASPRRASRGKQAGS